MGFSCIPISRRFEGLVRPRLVDQAVHQLGDSVIASVATWASLPSTSVADLEQALGHLDIVDEEKTKKSETVKKAGEYAKYVPKIGEALSGAAEAVSYGLSAHSEDSYQAYLREVAQARIRNAIENKKKEEEQKRKHDTDSGSAH